MKVSHWETFEWELGSLQTTDRPKLPPFIFRQATPTDRETVEKVLRSVLSQEPALSNAQDSPIPPIEEACEIAFLTSECACMVVQHGSRIIGASALNVSHDAPNHLLTGPSILHEYRSRGIGSALLFSSLDFLKDAGLSLAAGCAREKSVAARFVYPKFGGKVAAAVLKERGVPSAVVV
ncbi:MAG: GNAT family N-acetyltransferase [Pirellula staleyi]